MRCGFLLLAVALAAAPSRPARAAGTRSNASADDREAARPFAEKGYELYENGDYPRAMEFFLEAEKRFHAPPHLLFIARCQVKLGNLLAARAILSRVANEQVGEAAPKPFREAHDVAKAELDALDKRIPTLSVTATAGGATAAVTIDGKAIAATNEPVALDPGKHDVEASAPRFATQSRTVTLAPGARERLEMNLVPAAEHAATQRSIVPALVAFGAAGVLVVAGAATGAASLGKVHELDDACPDKRCDPSEASVGDAAKTLGTASTILFVGAGLAATAGAVLFVRAPKTQSSKARVTPMIGLGAVGVRGQF